MVISFVLNQEKIKVQHLEDKLRGAQTGSRGVNGEVSGIFASQITDDNMSTQATVSLHTFCYIIQKEEDLV